MALFKRGLKPGTRLLVLGFLERGQLLVAWSQFGMETWNDAMLLAASSLGPGDEILSSAVAELNDPVAVNDHLLPAAERQVEVGECMRNLFNSWLASLGEADRSALAAVLSATRAIGAVDSWVELYLAKARTRVLAIETWITNPMYAQTELTSLDQPEREAMILANACILDLKKVANFEDARWFGMTHEQFNVVRSELGMIPIPADIWASKFASGLTGARVRYFEQIC